ncbi:MAG: carbohydrate kinase family protein [Promethearchaeota archaeon]
MAGKALGVVGDVNIDIITPPFELPETETSCVLDGFTTSLGGNAINAAAAASSLGTRVMFFGCLGTDPISGWIREKCSALGVQLEVHELPGESAGITFAMTHLDGSRQFVATLGTNALLELEHLDRSKLAGLGHLHRAGFWYTLGLLGGPTVTLLESVHEGGVETSLDFGWDPANFPREHVDLLRETLGYVDYTFLNEKELRAVTSGGTRGERVAELLEVQATHSRDPVVVLHLGAEGAGVYTREEQVEVPPYTVKAVNPTGTGDVFNGAFLHGLLEGWPLERCARFANAVAAVHLGDVSKIYPTLGDYEEFLESKRGA